MLKISGSFGPAALGSVLLLSGAGTGLSIDNALADTCLAAPKTAAPAGQHWYYHVDRASRHKCWYLHSAALPHHRAVIRHRAAETAAAPDAAAPTEPQTAAEPPTAAEPQSASELQITAAPVTAADPPAQPETSPAAPAPDGATGSAPPAPHVTVLSVRTSTPFVDTTASPQQAAAERAPAPSAAALHDDAAPTGDNARPASTQSVQPQDNAVTATVAPGPADEATTVDGRIKTAEMFILLALVFGVAAAVVAILSKVLGLYRRPRISDDPDAAWLRYRTARQRTGAKAGSEEQDVPFLDPQDHYGLGDLHALDGQPPAQQRSTVAPPQVTDFTAPPAEADIEPALRALRQARQSRVA